MALCDVRFSARGGLMHRLVCSRLIGTLSPPAPPGDVDDDVSMAIIVVVVVGGDVLMMTLLTFVGDVQKPPLAVTSSAPVDDADGGERVSMRCGGCCWICAGVVVMVTMLA